MEEKQTDWTIRKNSCFICGDLQIYHWSRGRYGSPRITRELEAKGIRASHPFVAKLMRERGLRSIVKKKFKKTTKWQRRTTSLGFFSPIPCFRELSES